MTALLAAALLLSGGVRAQEEGAGRERWGILNVGGMLLFGSSRAPMSLVQIPAKPAGALDAGEVQARACQRGLAIPLAASLRPTTVSGFAGDGGYDRALAEVRKKKPETAGLYDVRLDARHFSILGGLYRSLCLELTARAYTL